MSQLVPFTNLVSEWLPLKDEVLARIERVFAHGQFIMGPEVIELEARLAEDTGALHALTCSSGTMALQLALMALEVGPGDEVILPAFTFAAPLEVVLLLGATPVLADINPLTYTLDAASAEPLITPRTRAIIAVSLYGHPADFTGLNELASRHGIHLIEDAAQSYGATLEGKRSGNLATTIGCTSFFPTKPLGGACEGGALFTNNPLLASRLAVIRDHGQLAKYVHSSLGLNGRLDSISCVSLLVAIGRIRSQIAHRQAVAKQYDELLSDLAARGKIQLPYVSNGATSAFAQYAVQVDDRASVVDAMCAANVQVAIHYPIPLHHQLAFRDRVIFNSLEHSESLARRVLCLPIYPTITEVQQQQVASALAAALVGSTS